MTKTEIDELLDKMSGWNSVIADANHNGGNNGEIVALAHICQNQADIARLLGELILEVRALR